ncbi:MAG: hypothetical protein JW991_04795 [Candidatus Pacebacteria bacterium]|nr:hypothetical protein [Candidatus Paceibacterota bacterium]
MPEGIANQLTRRQFLDGLFNLGTDHTLGKGKVRKGIENLGWQESVGERKPVLTPFDLDDPERKRLEADLKRRGPFGIAKTESPEEISQVSARLSLPIEALRQKHGLTRLFSPQAILRKSLTLLNPPGNDRYDDEKQGFNLCAIYGVDFVQTALGTRFITRRLDDRGQPVQSGGRELNAVGVSDWLSNNGRSCGWQDVGRLSPVKKYALLMERDVLLYSVRRNPDPVHTVVYLRLNLPFKRDDGREVVVKTVGYTQATGAVLFAPILYYRPDDEWGLSGYFATAGTWTSPTQPTYSFEKSFHAHSLINIPPQMSISKN